MKKSVSLVIPIRSEIQSIENLIQSIDRQTFQPNEVILVDGGSTDGTIEIVERIAADNSLIRLIKTDEATPGKGRNIGIENAANEWIALTDAGIRLEADWLEMLTAQIHEDKGGDHPDIIFGNFAPVTSNLFETCAAISYVAAKRASGIRGKSIASCLVRKGVWKAVGGFPDLRAAEDLMFMDAVDKQGFKTAFAPKAMMYWNLQPDLSSTFSKFFLYSKHNVWAGKQRDWHYGVLKQYLLLLPIIVLSSVHSIWWLLAIPLWLLSRSAKRILAHRYEFGLRALSNPLIVIGTAVLVFVIDMATFGGWIAALISKK